VVGHEPERPAGRLQLEREPSAVRVVAREPGREPVVAGRAAVAQRAQRHVRRLGRLPRGLERVLPPRDLDCGWVPGTPREQPGWESGRHLHRTLANRLRRAVLDRRSSAAVMAR
jgi:hypothetical protein